jgi:hypothetical protein
MHDPNQGAAADPPRGPLSGDAQAPSGPEAPLSPGAPDPGRPDPGWPVPPESEARHERGLVFWLVAVAVALPLSLFFGQLEMGLLTAVGGMFAVAHATERDQRWTMLHVFLGWIPPVGAAVLFGAMGLWFANAQLFTDVAMPAADRRMGALLSFAAALASLALLVRPVADAIARLALRAREPGPVDRLAARLVVISFLMAPAGWFFVKGLMAMGVLDQIAIGTSSFAGSLVGFTLLSLGAVGFPVRRGWAATFERLGLRRVTWTDVALVAGGLLGLILLNAGMEWVARTWWPDMYRRDLAMNELIAGQLTRAGMVMLGISAGVGEELAMRGALQPRLGLVGTSVLFAVLHVQYSPLGIGTIALIGVLLGLIRARGSTTAAIAVHVLYDIVAAASAQQQPAP